MTDILDTLKAAVADKDGTDPVELSAEDVYEIIGELAYLRRQEGLRRLQQLGQAAEQKQNQTLDRHDSNQISN